MNEKKKVYTTKPLEKLVTCKCKVTEVQIQQNGGIIEFKYAGSIEFEQDKNSIIFPGRKDDFPAVDAPSCQEPTIQRCWHDYRKTD
jgi:hypothetical protein